MTHDELRRTVLAALGDIAPEADLDQLAPEAELRETLDIDSMDFLRFVQQLAVSTGVEVPEADYARLTTLDDCVAYLGSRAS